MNYNVSNPSPFNVNGSNQDMANFMGMLESEESDFVDQVKKSKAFIQSVIKDKEELAGLVANHQAKIHKLEGERMGYQKKIIESERERRSFQEKLETEKQTGLQALRQMEAQKKEYDRLQQDVNLVTIERNDAVARLGQEMNQLEKLERDKRDMMARIDTLAQEQQQRAAGAEVGKSVGDLNMKLKMEIGALRGENEGLMKKYEDTQREISELENQIQIASRNLRLKDGEIQSSQARVEALTEEASRLKRQLDSVQEEARKTSSSESEVKVENAQLKSEHVAATDKIHSLQMEIARIEAEKKDNLNKIQSMQSEMRELRSTLEDFEANKRAEMNNLEASLTNATGANKKVNEKFENEKRLVQEMERSNADLKEQIEKLEIDNRKQQENMKNYIDIIQNKKRVEEELLETIRDIKEKVEKYEEEKKNIAKAERMRKSSVATQDKAEKKEWEERMEKLKLQFDKAAVESKKNINKLTEENTKANGLIEELQTDLEKKQVECRTLTTKLNSMEKEFARYKAQAKEEISRNEKTMEDMEAKISEGRRSAESWKRKHDTVQADLESTIKEKYSLQTQIENMKERIAGLKEAHSEAGTAQRNEQSKIEAKLRDANIRIQALESQKAELKNRSDEHLEELTVKFGDLKNELKKSNLEKDNLVKKLDRITGEKNSALEEEIENREKTIAEKVAEICDIKQAAHLKENKLKCDIDKEIEEKNRVTNKLNADIDTIKTDLNRKENQISKLEKEKREVSLAQDKSKKKINEIESEMTKLKEVLNRLETEKKTNNFGKYEREKMKLEIDNLTKEKQTVAGRIEDLNKEKYELSLKIKDLSKSEVVKNELSSKNEALDSRIQELTGKCKELEGSIKKDKEGGKSREKSLNEQIRLITNEKDKLQDKIDELEDSVKKNEKSITKLQSELGTAKNDLLDKDKQCTALQKDDNNTKAFTDRISLLEKQKYEIDTKTRELDTEKNALTFKVTQLQKDKDNLNKKIKDLEVAKEELAKKLQEGVTSSSSSSNNNDKKSKDDISKLQKENQGLKKEKESLGKSLKAVEKDLKKNIKDVKPNKVQGELKKLAERIENNSLLSGLNELLTNGEAGHSSESTNAIKSNFDSLQKDFESRTAEIEKLTSQLTRAKADSNSAVEKLRKSESELSQIKEKNAQLSDELLNKSRMITGMENGGQDAKELQRQVDDLRKKLADAQGGKVKKSVKFSAEPEVMKEPSKSVSDLEEALEAAYKERNHIIETCRKEVEFHRTIASELEHSIMEDFEWKLHEMEKDYNAKLKHSKEMVEEQIKEACRGILKEKDDEINKLGIKLRRDMDDKLKKEKEELAAALASVKGGNSDAVMDVIKKEKEQELAAKQKKWDEKRKKYHKEIDDLKKLVKGKDSELQQKVKGAQSDIDQLILEERRKHERLSTKAQEDMEKMRDELSGQITRLRAEHDEKIEDFESKLEKAMTDKMEKMLALREEVEVEYADKMDELRNMYREEMNNQVAAAERDKAKMQSLEKSLQDSLKSKRQDFDEMKVKYDEALIQVSDLERRLNNQTSEVIRLTQELECYEYQ